MKACHSLRKACCEEVESLSLETLCAGDREARQLAGLLLRELVRSAADTFSAHAAAVLPLAFVARSDEDADVAALWKEVWEEGTGSGAAAVRLYIDDIVPLICDGMLNNSSRCHKQSEYRSMSTTNRRGQPCNIIYKTDSPH